MKSNKLFLLLLLVPGIGWTNDHDDGTFIWPDAPYTVTFSSWNVATINGVDQIESDWIVFKGTNRVGTFDSEDIAKDMAEALNEAHANRSPRRLTINAENGCSDCSGLITCGGGKPCE